MHLDLLVFAAHPDDAEISCSGTLIKLGNQGYKTGVVTLTRGEMGSRGDEKTRKAEFDEASRIIGLAVHRMLDIPDANIQITMENKRKIIEVIREYRPTLVCTQYWVVRHPDHGNCSKLVQEAAFLAGLKNIETGQESYRPNKVIYTPTKYDFKPSFIVDISDTFDRKMEAIRAYKSQFHNKNWYHDKEENTYISSPQFIDLITARATYWGAKIGVAYGEPFLVREPLKINDPVHLFSDSRM